MTRQALVAERAPLAGLLGAIQRSVYFLDASSSKQTWPLGGGPLCGAQQRYLIRSPVVVWLGALALAFSAAAWQLAARDEWIGSELCSKRT
ncbi:MAG: DUF4338 domain-containing protein [Thiocapsa sp.]|nr:MAG: DUF4338 domain-containing protein [Thiocapsa sp.]